MFANANEFAWHYPDDRSLAWAFCAPRLEEGEIVEAVRRRLAARAGLKADRVDDAAESGPLDGRIDHLDRDSISGWAFDATRSHTPVRLEILVDGSVVGDLVANCYRPDLEAAGKGDGRCATASALRPTTNHGTPARLRSGAAAIRRRSGRFELAFRSAGLPLVIKSMDGETQLHADE
jgi:hypothetical protein